MTAPRPPSPPTDAAGHGGRWLVSAITSVDSTTVALRVGEQAWERTTGVVHGEVDPRERIAGLAALPTDAQGRYCYEAQFELITPRDAHRRDVVLVEVENRGRPVVLLSLEQFSLGSADSTPTGARYPDGLGLGFLAEHGLCYARVQCETGVAAGVPVTAQGVGQVVVRDFGRMLARSGPPADGAAPLPRFRSAILAGVSQSAWFVDTLVAEGFNVDPAPGAGSTT
ncbi:hypothetical protein [Blastococcus saxobsidens]|uniref:Uncharacterized protein n=1 Tax=Blastococcus saxobsidens (strain DD2) TaxID=1146883 RepID=H6RR41_BLASD|nr:hypothetical protein [Blastococcus saxobsidens]CCG04121.1 protein of unknown function [Blastococcus saxobsidens DD2]